MNRTLGDWYELFRDRYGAQGWWPILENGSPHYHPGEYHYPRSREQQFEIAVGAILTQNTAWINVEKALINLAESGLIHNWNGVATCDHDTLASLIRPAGYFNQKARYLVTFARFFGSIAATPTRHDLLALTGIGPETADSILLYAYGVPVFVVDAYTRRFLTAIGMISESATYQSIQELFHRHVPADTVCYQEYHALLVALGKEFFRTKPYRFSATTI